jgi:hypothetical protein
MALGILLYGGVNFAIDSWYKVSNPVATTTWSVLDQSIDSGIVLAGLALIVPLVVAATWGPLPAFVTILAGQYLGDLIAGYSANSDYYGGSWSWLVGRILIGLVAGLAVGLSGGDYTTARSLGIAFALAVVGIVVGTAFTTYADIWVLGRTAADAWTSFTILVLPALLAPLLLVLLLFARSSVLPKRSV